VLYFIPWQAEARESRPCAVARPRTRQQLVAAVRAAAAAVGAGGPPLPLTVVGGGQSSLCSRDGALLVDLRADVRRDAMAY
jgi:FAD/FMN-containing dehydrogenase